MKPGFRSMKEEARAKTRSLYEAANPIACSKCSRRFPTVKGLSEHHYSHIWEKTSAVKDLGHSSSQRQQALPPTATPVLPTPRFMGKPARQPDINPEKSIWKPLHVAGENYDGDKVAVPVGVNLQCSQLKAPAESTGVNTTDEVKQMELDLSLHL
ncbi:uncharacterized protein [Elaeis guineensis]|uniref:Uncharacterized protein LOC105050473 n=1 Tax=Elaeis guineensis var. tenera TaxID=51953 RepID=A0A6I9RMH2_ELAGV|nr:uncharacterized protein LOC105050473 [Elaeis guineensis]